MHLIKIHRLINKKQKNNNNILCALESSRYFWDLNKNKKLLFLGS